MTDIEISLIYLGENPVVCPKCKELNNCDNTICCKCGERLSNRLK
jgi:hypothetical protein